MDSYFSKSFNFQVNVGDEFIVNWKQVKNESCKGRVLNFLLDSSNRSIVQIYFYERNGKPHNYTHSYYTSFFETPNIVDITKLTLDRHLKEIIDEKFKELYV